GGPPEAATRASAPPGRVGGLLPPPRPTMRRLMATRKASDPLDGRGLASGVLLRPPPRRVGEFQDRRLERPGVVIGPVAHVGARPQTARAQAARKTAVAMRAQISAAVPRAY